MTPEHANILRTTAHEIIIKLMDAREAMSLWLLIEHGRKAWAGVVEEVEPVALELAKEAGWELDQSPATENSDETWWRLDATTAPMREDSLVDKFWEAAKEKVLLAAPPEKH